MRKLKFRVWDIKSNKYIENKDYLLLLSGNEIKIDEKLFIFEQFTGLLDKNDKEVYEGDVISGGILSEPCEVMFQESCGRFIAFGTHYKVLPHKFNQFDVIGNIYENPELLK